MFIKIFKAKVEEMFTEFFKELDSTLRRVQKINLMLYKVNTQLPLLHFIVRVYRSVARNNYAMALRKPYSKFSLL